MVRKNNTDENLREGYSFGYEEGMLDYQSYRALKSLDFVLPYLRPGMAVLECGSGPGVTTFEVAKKLTNGTVVGIDIHKALVDANNKKAELSNIKNLKFQVASILELPYPENSFDVVYMQAVLVHITNPINAVREVHRVLKKEGLILVKEPIMDRAIMSPENPLFLESFELIERTIKSYGGDPSVGRKLWPLLDESGFGDILMSSSWEKPDSLDEWPEFYEGWVKAMEGDVSNIILKNGWSDVKHLTKISNAWIDLGNNKRGYAASPWGEAVGKKKTI
jgi:ubiquinone/menaquinone biosynthesis C-methylase UbiE